MFSNCHQGGADRAGAGTSLWSQVVQPERGWEGGGTMGGWSAFAPPGLSPILMTTLTFLSGPIYLSFSFLSSDYNFYNFSFNLILSFIISEISEMFVIYPVIHNSRKMI